MKRKWVVITVIAALVLGGVITWLGFGDRIAGRTIVRPPVGSKYTVTAFAYSSTRSQTDSTPCVTAAGTRVRKGIIATNFLPLGTIVSIGDKLYIVEDRMNARYKGPYIDIWFPSRAEALQYGRKQEVMTIKNYGVPGQALSLDDEKDIVVEPSVTKRASLRFLAGARFTSAYLRASVGLKADEDCLSTE